MELFAKNLETLGLKPREIRVYTTLCVFGSLTITKLAGRAALPRTTVDSIVRRLEAREFVSKARVKGHYEWLAEDLTTIHARANEAFASIRAELQPQEGEVVKTEGNLLIPRITKKQYILSRYPRNADTEDVEN